MAVYGYIRVSTEGKGQTTENQRKALTDAGFAVTEFFSENGVSGSIKAMERPAFVEMMAKAVSGDTVLVVAVDRLGRNAVDVLTVIEEFKARGIKLRVQQFDGVDLTSSTGKLLVTVMAALAEMEKNILIERTHSGIARAKAEGTKFGPPLTIEPAIMRTLADHVRAGSTLDWLSNRYGIPRNTIHRNVKTWGDKLEEYEKEFVARKAQHAAKVSD